MTSPSDVKTPGGRILPCASILAKLKEIDPDAPDRIMSMSAKIRQDRHEAEIRQAGKFSLKRLFAATVESFANFTPGQLVLAGDAKHGVYPLRAVLPASSLQNDRAHVGNDMRRAIKAYMAERGIRPAQAGLTEAEIRSLDPVKTSSAEPVPAT